jgi:hypothetical protein
VTSVYAGKFFVKANVLDKKSQQDFWLIMIYGAALDKDKG